MLKKLLNRRCALWINFASACFFYFATFFVHYGISQNIDRGLATPDASVYVFFRQALGLLFVAPFFISLNIKKASSIKPNIWIVARCFFNLSALFCFYVAVAQGGAGRANVLNMAYPILIIILAGPLLKEKISSYKVFLTILCFLGVILHLIDLTSIGKMGSYLLGGSTVASFWALASAFLAALGIISLRGAAKKTSALTILFWLFLSGTFLTGFICYEQWSHLRAENWLPLLLSAFCGVSGQLCLTISYRNLDAVSGSIISTTRIPIALLIGSLFLAEHFLWNEYLGAVLIFLANILLSFSPQINTNK